MQLLIVYRSVGKSLKEAGKPLGDTNTPKRNASNTMEMGAVKKKTYRHSKKKVAMSFSWSSQTVNIYVASRICFPPDHSSQQRLIKLHHGVLFVLYSSSKLLFSLQNMNIQQTVRVFVSVVIRLLYSPFLALCFNFLLSRAAVKSYSCLKCHHKSVGLLDQRANLCIVSPLNKSTVSSLRDC